MRKDLSVFDKNNIEELGNCIAKQFPDEGIYRISRIEEWLATNGWTMEKLGVSDFHELIRQAPELFGTPYYNAENYVIVRRWHGRPNDAAHPADSFFGNKNIILNDDIIEMSQQSLYALTKVMGWGLSVQEMKQEIYDSFARERDAGKLIIREDRYIFRIGCCADGFQVNGIITKNISPRGKSLYFSFEKTEIRDGEFVPRHRAAAPPAEVSQSVKAEIYRLLSGAFPFDVPQHMAAVSKLLTDNHIDRAKFGFMKMKDLLAQMDYLEMTDIVLGGVPQIMVTLHRSPDYQAAAYQPAAHTGETAQRSGEIPAGSLEDFCYLPQKPLGILIQFLENSGVRRDISDLHTDLAEDFDKARADGAVRFYDGKMIFPCRWKRSDGTPVELTLKPSTYEGRQPWFLNFVDTQIRGREPRGVQPGRRLENFAFLGSWSAFLTELAEKAVPESWDFAGSQRRDYHILIQYIKYTFYRLTRENKVCISDDRQFACFNTGLVDKHYDDIYACFTPNDPGCETEWKFAGFCTAANRTLGKQIVNYFSPLPQPPCYFERGEQLFFDVNRQLLTDFDHIIIDNADRLPLQFLSEQFTDCREAADIVSELRTAQDNFRKRELYEQLRQILTDNNRLFVRIQNRIKDSIELARKRVTRNYKTAIPSYYPKRNSMSLMLPLCLTDEEEPDIALVVEQTPSGNYQGQTILTLGQAYIDARLLCQLNSEWLTTGIRTGQSEEESEE